MKDAVVGELWVDLGHVWRYFELWVKQDDDKCQILMPCSLVLQPMLNMWFLASSHSFWHNYFIAIIPIFKSLQPQLDRWNVDSIIYFDLFSATERGCLFWESPKSLQGFWSFPKVCWEWHLGCWISPGYLSKWWWCWILGILGGRIPAVKFWSRNLGGWFQIYF